MPLLKLEKSSDALPESTTTALEALGLTLRQLDQQQPNDGHPALCYSDGVLSTHLTDGQLSIDWLHGKTGYRRTRSSIGSEAVARAVGLKPGKRPAIADLTAGLGRDAFMLASLGSEVTMVERSPILAALLCDALQRLRSADEVELSHRLQLVHASSIDWAARSGGEFDCCYLDPMYPHRRKSSLVKQDLRLLRDIVGSDDDAQQLFEAAMASGCHRVVVKRPSYAERLSGITKPSHTIDSGATRFDVYLRFA